MIWDWSHFSKDEEMVYSNYVLYIKASILQGYANKGYAYGLWGAGASKNGGEAAIFFELLKNTH